MTRLVRWLRRVRALVRPGSAEAEMDEEIRLHLLYETQKYLLQGFTLEQARRRAVLAFGGVEKFREEIRDERGLRWVETLAHDLRFAVRTLRRSPGFTLVAILTLALGIGATTAIFSAVHGVLLRPLPYETPERVVRILGTDRNGENRGTLSYPDILDFRAQARSFAGIAAYDEWLAIPAGNGEPERVAAASVNSSFFEVLGVRPALGRFFRPEEDQPGHDPAVVLSYALWRRRFGADPRIVGRWIEVNDTRYTVVGVAPADFEDPSLSGASYDDPVLWRVTPSYFNPEDSSRDGHAFTAVARLRPGVSLESAQAEIDAITRRLEELYPEENAGRGARLVTLQDEITAPVRPALLVLLAATAVVVLIACANVANLLLARAAGREREIAIRTAIGASRSRIVRQLLTESSLLALVGGTLGILLAAWVIGPLVSLGGASLARSGQIRIDGTVLFFAVSTSLLTGLLFGLAPALQTLRADLLHTLREGSRGTVGRGMLRLRNVLVAAEVALSLLLLTGAGLLIRSLWTLQSVDPGFRAEGVLALEISTPAAVYDSDAKIVQLYAELLPRLEALPGVERVATTDILPMSGSFDGRAVRFDDRSLPNGGEEASVEMRVVSPSFFAAMGIPLRRGRVFTGGDRLDAPPQAIVDETTAERFWPGTNPVGKRLTVLDTTSWEVVGVVGGTRQFALDRAPEPTLYVPRNRAQPWFGGDATIIVRTSGEPMSLAPAVRAAIRAIDPRIPISNVRTLDEVVASTALQPRFRTVLLSLFAAVALTLGLVGIYGVVAYAVARRTSELGIRMALGASRRQIFRLVMRQGMRPILIGIGLGLLGALGTGRVLATFLFGVPAADPLTFVSVTAALSAVAALACYIPARHATRVDPLIALRAE